jgi:7,8-dihydropterin-6-yl-methyl-4-(beta-D-ribofuranosyl)aminobenzene 5'-phosphate synthase
LSHGHRDHFESLTDVLHLAIPRLESREWERDITAAEIESWIASHQLPVVAHPACFRERWVIAKDGRRYGPSRVPGAEWEAAGAELILTAAPYPVAPGCWTTGAVPRRSFEQAGTPPRYVYRAGEVFIRDYLEDDQSIVINVRGKGLVVVTGCAHSGVVNTVNYAREVSGVDRVWTILGGFHLAPADDDEIERTIDEIAELEPQMVVPSHCTGWQARMRFAQRMPGRFVEGTVGTTYLF